MFSGSKADLLDVMTFLAQLNSLSDGTDVATTSKYFHTMRDKLG